MSNSDKLTIVTTIGTSIFENLITYGNDDIDVDESVIKDIKPYYVKKHKEERLAGYYWSKKSLKKRVDELSNSLIDEIAKYDNLDDYMAEVSSIEGIIKEKKKEYSEFEIIPICSDTAISVIAAEILRRYYENKPKVSGASVKVRFKYPYGDNNIEIDENNVYYYKDRYKDEKDKDKDKCTIEATNFIIKGLQVLNKGTFEKEGLVNLFSALRCIYEESNKALVFNITGGYKAIIPYMIIFSQVYEAPAYYMFEHTKTLLTIPQLPIDLDMWTLDENFTALQEIHRKSDDNLPTVDEFKNDYLPKGAAEKIVKELERKNILEEFKYKDKIKVKLTLYGDLLMDRLTSKGETRQNIASLLVELQLFKFFVNKHKGKTKSVKHSKEVGGEDKNEIDVFVEFKEPIERAGSGEKVDCICAEVKPAGNVPIKGDGENTLEHSLKEGGLRKCFDECNEDGKKVVEPAIYLYGIHKDLSNSVKRQLHKLIDELDNDKLKKSVRVYLLKLAKNFKNNNHWSISDENKGIIDLTQEIMETNYDENSKTN